MTNSYSKRNFVCILHSALHSHSSRFSISNSSFIRFLIDTPGEKFCESSYQFSVIAFKHITVFSRFIKNFYRSNHFFSFLVSKLPNFWNKNFIMTLCQDVHSNNLCPSADLSKMLKHECCTLAETIKESIEGLWNCCVSEFSVNLGLVIHFFRENFEYNILVTPVGQFPENSRIFTTFFMMPTSAVVGLVCSSILLLLVLSCVCYFVKAALCYKPKNREVGMACWVCAGSLKEQ